MILAIDNSNHDSSNHISARTLQTRRCAGALAALLGMKRSLHSDLACSGPGLGDYRDGHLEAAKLNVEAKASHSLVSRHLAQETAPSVDSISLQAVLCHI